MDTSELRKSYIELLTSYLGIQGFDTSIPLDHSPLPTTYFLVSNVTRTINQYAKGFSSDVTAFRNTEYRVFLNVDISVVTDLGFHSSYSVEQMIETVIEKITKELNPVGYYVKETKVVNVVPLNLITETHNINRMVVAFEHWISKR